MNTWPPALRRTLPVPEQQKVPTLAVWSVRLSVAGVVLFGLLFGSFMSLRGFAPFNSLHIRGWLALFLVCPMLWFPGLITGLIAREQPMARLSIIIAVVALIIFVALMLPVLQPVRERA